MKNCLTPQIYENVRPHSSNSVENSQSSHENTTPFSSTSPLASYKEVPPPPTHPGHYPDLGSDMLSAWISVLVAQTSFHRKTVVALQNVSWFQAIPHHVNILLVSSSSLWTAPPDVIFYFTIFNLYFLSSILKMPCEYHFVLYIFLNTGSLLTLRLIHQTGLTDNIDEVIKEYKETRGLLVWEAFCPWYIMFW